MKKIVLIVLIVSVMLTGTAVACLEQVGTANTEVYVRDLNGDVVGSLAKGDHVVVTGSAKNGYLKVNIGGKDYKVYGDYLVVNEACVDEIKLISKPRKSKSGGKVATITGKTAHSIKGSDFENVFFW